MFVIAESETGANKDREGIVGCRLREQEEGRRGEIGGPGVGPGERRELQGRGHLRVAASPSAEMSREDHGEYTPHFEYLIIVFCGNEFFTDKTNRVDGVAHRHFWRETRQIPEKQLFCGSRPVPIEM